MELSIIAFIAFVLLALAFGVVAVVMAEICDSPWGGFVFISAFWYLMLSVVVTLGKVVTAIPKDEGLVSSMISILGWSHVYSASPDPQMIAIFHCAVIGLALFTGMVSASKM